MALYCSADEPFSLTLLSLSEKNSCVVLKKNRAAGTGVGISEHGRSKRLKSCQDVPLEPAVAFQADLQSASDPPGTDLS